MPEPMSGWTGLGVGDNPTSDNYFHKAEFSGDGCPDVLGRGNDNNLRYWPGNCDGSLDPAASFGSWGAYNSMFTPGDLTLDGCADVVARSSGRLYYAAGNCQGGLASAVSFTGVGWNAYDALMGPGYFDAHGCVGVMARAGNQLYYWSGYNPVTHRCEIGLWGPTPVGGSIWDLFSNIFGPGDLNDDGCADVAARWGGDLWWWPGNCNGGVGTGTPFASGGWANYDFHMGPWDFNGHGCADVIARQGSGLYRWAGSRDAQTGQCIPGLQDWAPIGSTGWGNYNWLFAP